MAEEHAEAICMVCRRPIERGAGRYSVGDHHYHPECYEAGRRSINQAGRAL